MEVVIFEVGHHERSSLVDSSSAGSSSVGSRGLATMNGGPISVCLWAPVKCKEKGGAEIGKRTTHAVYVIEIC